MLFRSQLIDNDIECVCKLLTEIGNTIDKSREKDINLENTVNVNNLNNLSYIGQYMYYLKLLINLDKNIISSRIKFMIKDLIDCRKNNWIERTQKIRSSKLCDIK